MKNRIDRKESVQVRRLDEILEDCLTGINEPRIYLKMDTQGFDMEVLTGSEYILPQVLGLQTEVSFRSIYSDMKSYNDLVAECKKRGFEIVDFLPVAREREGLCAIEMDCIMTRPREKNWRTTET